VRLPESVNDPGHTVTYNGIQNTTGHELVISNDSDFGLADFEGTGTNSASPPWQLIEKVSPVTGQEDNGEYWRSTWIASTPRRALRRRAPAPER
jgi:hypothetical protein